MPQLKIVQSLSRSVVSDSLNPHELQHSRLPCPSPTPGAYPNWCPSSQWYHSTVSSSVVPFFCLHSFPASGSFLMSQFTSGGQRSFSFSISPSNEYSGLISFKMDWLDLFAVQGTLQESSPTPQFKSINSLVLSFFYGPTLTSIHLTYILLEHSNIPEDCWIW